MTTIVRNSSHGNHIRVIFFPELEMFRKTTFNLRSKALLESEASGISWYYSRRNFDESRVNIYSYENYTRLDFPSLKGFKLNYGLPFRKNFLFFELALSHYINTWPSSGRVPCHGDLTLDNILIHQNTATFIDWEHFQIMEECWGFDMCYLCLSMVCLPFIQGRRIEPEDWVLFSKYWQRLKELGVSKDLIQTPLDYFKGVFNSNSTWQVITEVSPNKMYPLILGSDFCNQIQERVRCTDNISY